GVVDPRDDPGLDEEHADELRFAGQVRMDHLDRDDLLETCLALGATKVDRRHAAVGDAVDQLVATNPAPQHQRFLTRVASSRPFVGRLGLDGVVWAAWGHDLRVGLEHGHSAGNPRPPSRVGSPQTSRYGKTWAR